MQVIYIGFIITIYMRRHILQAPDLPHGFCEAHDRKEQRKEVQQVCPYPEAAGGRQPVQPPEPLVAPCFGLWNCNCTGNFLEAGRYHSARVNALKNAICHSPQSGHN